MFPWSFSCEIQADDKTSIAIDEDKTSPDLLSTICISLILTVSSNVVARITSFDKSPYVDVLLPLKLAVAFALPSNVFFFQRFQPLLLPQNCQIA